jgi:hypothetical protein
MHHRRRPFPARRVAHLGALMLLAVVIVGGEQDSARINMVPTPSRSAIGSDALVTWTISDTLPSGALVDVALTQDDVDRFVPWWDRVDLSESTTFHADNMGPMRSGNPRSLRLADDHLLTYPIEVLLAGWQNVSGGVRPGTYRIFWWSGHSIRSAPTTFTVDPPIVGTLGAPAISLWQDVYSPQSYGMDATFLPDPLVRTTDDLTVRVTRIGQEYDRAEIWRSAVVEWTRLPDHPDAPTRIYSPIQAGVVAAASRAPGPAVRPASRELHFPVANALRDPIAGAVVSGLYRIRLAMAWNETVTSPAQPDTTFRYSIRSRGQVVRLLAPGEEPPTTCPVCGAVRSSDSAPAQRPAQP